MVEVGPAPDLGGSATPRRKQGGRARRIASPAGIDGGDGVGHCGEDAPAGRKSMTLGNTTGMRTILGPGGHAAIDRLVAARPVIRTRRIRCPGVGIGEMAFSAALQDAHQVLVLPEQSNMASDRL